MRISRPNVPISLCLGACMLALTAAAENQVQTTLLSDASSIAPGDSIRVGVHFQLPEHAHIYWRNPGDSGLATGIEWQLPDGVQIGDLQWPNPKQFRVDGLDDINFGYENEVILFATVSLEKPFEDKALTITARAYWLICLDDGVCIPEDANLEIAIPIAGTTQPSEHRKQFDASAGRVPMDIAALTKQESSDWLGVTGGDKDVTARIGDAWELVIPNSPEEAVFFPYAGPAWTRSVPLIDQGVTTLTFEPQESESNPASGALTLPVRRKDGTESRTLYIEITDAD